MRFKDRTEAGSKLAHALVEYCDKDGIVYPLPRGGVTLGVEVANELHMPIDLIIPRKIGHPYNREYAICAVAESGELACNQQEVAQVDQEWFKQQVQQEREESRRRRDRYLSGRAPYDCTGKIAIIVDDGIATGLTMLAAIRDAKSRHAEHIVVAVPVVPADTAERLRHEVDDVVALDIPEFYMGAVGAYYDYFPQVTDDQVIELLSKQHKQSDPAA